MNQVSHWQARAWTSLALSSLRYSLLQSFNFSTANPVNASVRAISVKGALTSLRAQPNISYVWQRWHGLVQALAVAAHYRCVFFVFCRPALRPLGEALGWHSWPASRLMWLACKQFLYNPTSLETEDCLPRDLSFIVVGDLPSLEIRRLFLRTSRPILGCFGEGSVTPMLWASGGFGTQAIEAEFGALALIWLTLSAAAATAVWSH